MIKNAINYDYLEQEVEHYLKYYKLTLSDLAKKVGISTQTLKRSLKSERDFKVIEISKLQQILGIRDYNLERAFFTLKNKSSSESKKGK